MNIRKNVGFTARVLGELFLAYAIGAADSVFGHDVKKKPSKLFKKRRAHNPHQSAREKARRLRQRERGIINI